MFDPALQEASRPRIERVRVAADLMDRPRRVDALATALVGAPDHVVDHVAAADGRAAAAVLGHVVEFLDLERRHVAIFGQAGRRGLNLAPPVGRVGLHRDLLHLHDQVGRADRPGGGILVLLRRRHVGRVAARSTGVRPLRDRGDLCRAERRIVLVLLDADVLLDVPRRHHAGLGPDAGPRLDGARPGAHLVVGLKRHRRHAVPAMAVLTAALKNRCDVFGIGDRLRQVLSGYRRRHEQQEEPDGHGRATSSFRTPSLTLLWWPAGDELPTPVPTVRPHRTEVNEVRPALRKREADPVDGCWPCEGSVGYSVRHG